MSAALYKMTEVIPSTSAHLIDRSEDVIFELVWVIKRSILSFPVYITKKKFKSVIDSAVLHWTTWLMVFPRNAGFGRCYLVSTRHEILSNIDRNAKPNRNSAAAPKKPTWNKSRESTDPIPVLLPSLQSQTVVFQPFDFHQRKFKKFIIETFYFHNSITRQHSTRHCRLKLRGQLGRHGSAPISTVLPKSVAFFIINNF